MTILPALTAIAGVVLGFALTWILERSRWQRQLNIRWDEARLAIYAEFLAAMQGYYRAQMAVKDEEGISSEDTQAWKDGLRHLGVISTKISEMGLISSAAVHQAAKGWFQAANDAIAADIDTYFSRLAEMRTAHGLFVEAAHQELLFSPPSGRSKKRCAGRPDSDRTGG